jgi:hypothetical protein
VQSIVVSSIFGELYSTNDGTTFQGSTGGGTSQSVRFVGVNGDGGEKFGVTGTYGSVEGVGFSVDGGASFTTFDAKLTTEARYGAFPTDTTWYVAAGTLPNLLEWTRQPRLCQRPLCACAARPRRSLLSRDFLFFSHAFPHAVARAGLSLCLVAARAGEWPSSGNDDDPASQDDDPQNLNKRNIPKRFRKSRLQKANGRMMSKMSELEAEVRGTPTGSYQAQITKVLA